MKGFFALKVLSFFNGGHSIWFSFTSWCMRLNTTIALKGNNIAKLHVPSYVYDFFLLKKKKKNPCLIWTSPWHDNLDHRFFIGITTSLFPTLDRIILKVSSSPRWGRVRLSNVTKHAFIDIIIHNNKTIVSNKLKFDDENLCVYVCFPSVRGLAMRLQPIENAQLAHAKFVFGLRTWSEMVEYMSHWVNVFHVANSWMTVCPRHPATRGANCLVDFEEASKIADNIFDGRTKASSALQQVSLALEADEAAQKVYYYYYATCSQHLIWFLIWFEIHSSYT